MLRQEGIGYFNARQRTAILYALKSAALVAACEERQRILKIESLNSRHRELITEPSVLSVLGYED